MQVQLKYLAEEMQAISKGLEKVVQELTASENDGRVSGIFCKVLYVQRRVMCMSVHVARYATYSGRVYYIY